MHAFTNILDEMQTSILLGKTGLTMSKGTTISAALQTQNLAKKYKGDMLLHTAASGENLHEVLHWYEILGTELPVGKDLRIM